MNFNIDLKNIDLKNITMDDIKAKLKNVEKKTWIKIGISFGAVVLFLIIFYGILNPIVNKKKAKLDDMINKQEETQEFIKNIQSANNKIKELRPRYEQYSTLFHSRAEVEGLYQTLSEFAGMNNLVISQISKGEIKQVTKAEALAKADGKKQKANNNQKIKVENVAYYTIPVNFEITGNFIGYIKFKRQLSLSQKMLNFDKESIQVVKGKDTTTKMQF